MMKSFKFLVAIGGLIASGSLLAQQQIKGGVGDIASNALVPVDILASFIASASVVIGLACLFGAIVRYSQHRLNPLASPISTVITLFILGILLLILPLIYKLTESGIPYSIS